MKLGLFTKAFLSFLFVFSLSHLSAAAIQYGAGEMKNPARTFYISTQGNDRNDGKTLKTAWKSIENAMAKLQAGDTLEIAGGEYTVVNGVLNFQYGGRPLVKQSGKPGAPIRIRGMKGEKVVLRPGEFIPLKQMQKKGNYYQVNLKKGHDNRCRVWECPSQVRLQNVWNPEPAKEYPGTYAFPNRRTLLVHFAALDQQGVYVSPPRIRGFLIGCSYVEIENLTFEYYDNAIRIGAGKHDEVDHITIRNCTFCDNDHAGVMYSDYCIVSFLLFEGNRGIGNGEAGLFRAFNGVDNLITGNWTGPSPMTQRNEQPYGVNFGINTYGYSEKCARNLFIGNVMDNERAFRWKTTGHEDRLEGNILNGNLFVHVQHGLDKVYVRNNYIKGSVDWGHIGGNLWDKNFKKTPVVFENNTRDMKQFKTSDAIQKAMKLKIVRTAPKFPALTFKNVTVKHILADGAAILWETPECDGVGTVEYRKKGTGKILRTMSPKQGVRHCIGLSGLQADTEYEYRLSFSGRRGDKGTTGWKSFKTASRNRVPETIYVVPGKMPLEEISMLAVPGDTIILKKGTHTGIFEPIRSGTKEHPITFKAEKGAVIDGRYFQANFVYLDGKHHFVIEGIVMRNPDKNVRKPLISMKNSSFITVRNCSISGKLTPSPFVEATGHDFLIENNLINKCDYSLQVQGKNIVVRHNTIVNAFFCCVFAIDTENLEVTDNIFYNPCLWFKFNPPVWVLRVKGNIVIDRNVHWSVYKGHLSGGRIYEKFGKIKKQSKTLAEWQQMTGWEKNSIQADPLFVNEKQGNFRLKENSPAKGKGVIFP